jgi:hypothetical protein
MPNRTDFVPFVLIGVAHDAPGYKRVLMGENVLNGIIQHQKPLKVRMRIKQFATREELDRAADRSAAAEQGSAVSAARESPPPSDKPRARRSTGIPRRRR